MSTTLLGQLIGQVESGGALPDGPWQVTAQLIPTGSINSSPASSVSMGLAKLAFLITPTKF